MTKEQAIIRCKEIIITKFNLDYSIDSTDKEAIETVLSMLKEKDKELEKKDKQIDYIIDWIRERSIYAVDSHEKLKQYFERKATNNG